MKTIKLTNDHYDTLCRFLQRLTDDSGWLNSKWIQRSTVHEIAVMHGIAKKLLDRREGAKR